MKIKNLSKGQRAKVSLSLALSHDPELLILDEPTSRIDAMVRREFLESMVDRASTGKTVFLSSHQIAEVERVADTVAILKQSELRLVERLDDLKASAHLITVTLKHDGDFSCPLGTVVQRQTEGRNVRILGRNLDAAARSILQQDENVAQFEIRQPSLEEIFIAYMS
jgi:ABC-2 type transport system ATP-binding protein